MIRGIKVTGGIVFLVLLLAACNEPLRSIDFPDFSNVQFSVSAGNVNSDGVSLIVRHDGSERDTYYGFATKDTGSDINAVINRKISELSSGGDDYSGLIKNGSFRIMNVSGLEPSTDYRYVVLGLNEDGTVYGTPGSCAFRTAKGAPVFGLSLVGSPMYDAVKLSVLTSGDDDEQWYCFATTDLATSIETLCQTNVNGNPDVVSANLRSGSCQFELSGLRHKTAYRAIVVGVQDGKAYGKPAEVTFTTPQKEIVPELNPAWTIENLGAGELTNKGETATYKQRISCTATSEDRYFIMVMSQAEMKRYYNDDLVKFFIAAADYMTQSLEASNKEAGTSYTWVDISYTASAKEGYNLIKVGDYNAYAIGVDNAGTPTGKYAVSPTFSIEPALMSEQAKQWLGKWKIGDDAMSYEVTITPDPYQIKDQYAVYGWEGKDLLDVPFVAQFDEQTGEFIFIASFLADIRLDSKGTSVQASIGFFGLKEKSVIIPQSDKAYQIAGAEFLNPEKTSARVTTKILPDDGTGQSISFTSFGYFASERASGKIIGFSDNYPGLPMTMTKISSDTTVPFGFTLSSSSPLRTYSGTTGTYFQRNIYN